VEVIVKLNLALKDDTRKHEQRTQLQSMKIMSGKYFVLRWCEYDRVFMHHCIVPAALSGAT